jgi:Protein of unknown function (DUF3485)
LQVSKRTTFAIVATLGVLLGIALETRSYPTAHDAMPFHQAIREAVATYPTEIGQWIGADEPVPTSATELLKPNAIFARRFRHQETGMVASVVVIQCQDSRDMAGHYPPICYPNSGWALEPTPNESGKKHQSTLDLWGQQVPFAEYVFALNQGARTQRLLIHNFFMLPGHRMLLSMDAVRDASGDYTMRPYGAAQVQVIFEASIPADTRLESMRELLSPLAPAAAAMMRAPGDAEAGS